MLKKREHHVYRGLSTVPVVFSIVLQFFPVVDFNAALKKIKVFYLLAARGIAMGGISVYIPPKSVTILFTCGTLTHVLKLQ